jgi:anaerobic ribonucleoside-triphosphate reductase activating protein
VVTFTGLTVAKIREADSRDWDALLAVTDLLIDGPFVAALADQSRPWVGSSNQSFHFLTPRYRQLQEALGRMPNTLEVHISPSGVVRTNGMMPDSALARLFGNSRFIV